MGEKENELVSVIVPVYNVENYIERCLDSIINQTYHNLEILIVNDGSTDKSAELCLKYVNLDKRIVYIVQENAGLASARNRALEVMNGDYVICVDSDDFISLNMIEKLLYTAQETKADYVSCNYSMIDDNNYECYVNKCAATKMQIEESSKTDTMRKLLFPQSRYCSAWGKLYAKELWKENLRYPEGNRFGEDMYIAHILIDRANKIIHMDCPMYCYNQSGVSLVRSAFNENKLNMLDAVKEWIIFFRKKYPQLEIQAYGLYYVCLVNFFTMFLEGNAEKYYFQYRKELRTSILLVLKNKYVGVMDKIKALLISCSSMNTYRRIRNLL